MNDLWHRYLTRWLSLTLSRSSSKVKAIGQSSRSQEENVAKVVDANSIEVFLNYTGFCVVCGLMGSDRLLTRCMLTKTYTVKIYRVALKTGPMGIKKVRPYSCSYNFSKC